MRPAKVFLCLLACAPPRAIAAGPFEIDASRAPWFAASADAALHRWTDAYRLVCDELSSPGFPPPAVIRIVVDPAYDGIAGFDTSQITLSATWAREHPEEVDAAIVHELAHAIQSYRPGTGPMWLVEGIADYVRFFRWQPGSLGHINPDRAHYHGSYRITASFLNYLVERYDRELVRKLNHALRHGVYRDALFRDITGKPLHQLGEEWRATPPRTPADFAPDAAVDVEETADDAMWRLRLAALVVAAIAVVTLYRRRQYGRRPM